MDIFGNLKNKEINMCNKIKSDTEITGDFEKCKMSANAFLEVAEIINHHRWQIDVDGMDNKFGSPHATNIAFACELFIKAILLKQKGKHPNTHNLEKLFKMMNGKTQNQVIEKYNNYKNNCIDFKTALKTHSKSFEDWRYIYEDSSNNEQIYFYINELSRIAFSLRDVCNSI